MRSHLLTKNLLCLGREEIIERPKVSPPSTKSSPASKNNMRLDLREERRPPASVQTKTKVEQLIESESESEEDIDLEDAEDDGRMTPILLYLEHIISYLFPLLCRARNSGRRETSSRCVE